MCTPSTYVNKRVRDDDSSDYVTILLNFHNKCETQVNHKEA